MIDKNPETRPTGQATDQELLRLMQPALRRHVLREKFHLVGEDAPIGQNQILGAIRHIGQIHQFHARTFRRAITLALIAIKTCAMISNHLFFGENQKQTYF